MANKLPPRVVRYGGAMFGDNEKQRVNDVLNDPMGLVPGARIVEFERCVADFMGKRHGVMVNSGSSALMIAMRLLNLPQGSEVITPALTFSTDVASIYHAGYRPVFVDVGLSDYQILHERIEDVITPNTRAMLVPDLVGGIGDWDALRALADKHNLLLVHDSADTLGGTLGVKRRLVGPISLLPAFRSFTLLPPWVTAAWCSLMTTNTWTRRCHLELGGAQAKNICLVLR